jgi:hypothetical protein
LKLVANKLNKKELHFNDRPVHKHYTATNTIVYWDTATIMAVKSFILEAHAVIKNLALLSVIYPLLASSPKVFPRTDGHIFLGTSYCQNSFSGSLQIGERDRFQNRKEMFKRERQKDKAIPKGSQVVEYSS